MKLSDVTAYSIANLRRHALRTSLTVCGVAVGVGTLTLLVSLGFGLEEQATGYFRSAEIATRITVLPEGTKSELFRGMRRAEGEQAPLTDDTVAAIGDIPGVVVAYPGVYARLAAESPREVVAPLDVEGLPVGALTDNFQDSLVAGRYWEAADAGRVGVLPSHVLSDLGFAGAEEAIGEELALSRLQSLFPGGYEREEVPIEGARPGPDGEPPTRTRFIRPDDLEVLPVEVIGVYDSERFGYMGERLHVPLPLAKELERDFGFMQRGEEGEYQMVVAKVDAPSDVNPVREAIEERGYDTMTVFDILWIIEWVFVVFEVALGLFGSIGLLVAFFGIANTMVMAVLERTREIGVLKALGARNRDIRRMVFVEAAGIGFAGGGVGLFFGWLIGVGLNSMATYFFASALESQRLEVFYVPAVLVAVALALSTLVAAVAGIYPAWRAARLDPVISLRTE